MFSNSTVANARMLPFGNWTAIVGPIPITRIGSAHEWWRTRSPSRKSCRMAITRESKRLQSRAGAFWGTCPSRFVRGTDFACSHNSRSSALFHRTQLWHRPDHGHHARPCHGRPCSQEIARSTRKGKARDDSRCDLRTSATRFATGALRDARPSLNSDQLDPPMTLPNMRLAIVAKRRDRPYRSGRTTDWIKIRNPSAPVVTRLLEE